MIQQDWNLVHSLLFTFESRFHIFIIFGTFLAGWTSVERSLEVQTSQALHSIRKSSVPQSSAFGQLFLLKLTNQSGLTWP